MLNDKIVCFALLARNCKKELESNLIRIESIKPYFKETFVIVVENDSTDGTKQSLINWQKNTNNFIIITNTNINNEKQFNNKFGGMERNIRMAFYRNQYIKYIEDNYLIQKIDYLIVIDSHIGSFSVGGIIKAIENAPEDWAALFANGRFYFDLLGVRLLGRYYDLFAFIPNGENTDLTFREMAFSADLVTNRILKKKCYMECCSAFAGIGVYKSKTIKDNEYKTHKNRRSNVLEAVCEHIAFNLECKKHGKNYIAYDMSVYYKKRMRSIISKIIPIKIKINLYEFLTRRRFPE